MRGLSRNNKDVDFIIDTLEDLHYQSIREPLFDYMRSLIDKGYTIHLYRKGADSPLTRINSLEHFTVFKKSLRLPLLADCN